MHWIVWFAGSIYLVGFIANTHVYYNKYMEKPYVPPCYPSEDDDRMALYGKYVFADALVFTMFALRYAVTICASLYLLTSSDWTYVLGRDAYARLGRILRACGRRCERRRGEDASSPTAKTATAGTKIVIGVDPLVDESDDAVPNHIVESCAHHRRGTHRSLREHLLPLISCQSAINLFVAYAIHSLFSSNGCTADHECAECEDGVIAHAGVAAAATTGYLIRALVLFTSVHAIYATRWFMSNTSTTAWRRFVTGATRSCRRRPAPKLFDRCAVGHWERRVLAPILCVVWLVCVDCNGVTAALPSATIIVVAPVAISLLYATLFRTRTVTLRARYRRDSSAISAEFEMMEEEKKSEDDSGAAVYRHRRGAAQYMYVSILGVAGESVGAMDLLRSWMRWYRCVSSSVSMSQRTSEFVDTTVTYWQYLFENCACRDIAERYYRVTDPQRRLSRFRDTAKFNCSSSIDSRCIEIPMVRIRVFGPFYAQVRRWNHEVDNRENTATGTKNLDDANAAGCSGDDGCGDELYETIDECATPVRPDSSAAAVAINICVDGGFFTLADNETTKPVTRRHADDDASMSSSVRTFWYVSHTSYLRAAKSLSLRSPVIARLFDNTDVVNIPDGTFELRSRHIVKRERRSSGASRRSSNRVPVALSARWHPEIATIGVTSPSIVDASLTAGETTTAEIWYANEFARGDDHRQRQQQPAVYDSVPSPRPVAPLRSPLTVPLTRRSPITTRGGGGGGPRIFENPAYDRKKEAAPTSVTTTMKPSTSMTTSSPSFQSTISIHRTDTGSIDVMRPMVRKLSNVRIASVSVYVPSKASYDSVPLYMSTVFDAVGRYSEYRCTG